MDGIARCAKYAFGPNRLHYCGPDKSITELGAEFFLRQFKTLYPYLRQIAAANNIQDPFNARVVEAYWLGNELLENVGRKKLYNFLLDDLAMKKKMKIKEWHWLETKLNQNALPHHSFHVLNLWRQKVEALSECCVNAGEVISISGPEIKVRTEVIIYEKGKLIFSPSREKILTRQLEAEYEIEQLQPGQIISFHWDLPCEVISKKQATALKKYTLQNLALANQTI